MSTIVTDQPNAEVVRRGYEAFNNLGTPGDRGGSAGLRPAKGRASR
jgi:hypothetical protein